jgi:hypothetical protein
MDLNWRRAHREAVIETGFWRFTAFVVTVIGVLVLLSLLPVPQSRPARTTPAPGPARPLT